MWNHFASPRVTLVAAETATRCSGLLRQRACLPAVSYLRTHSSLIFTQHDHDRLQEDKCQTIQQDFAADEYYTSAAARAGTMAPIQSIIMAPDGSWSPEMPQPAHYEGTVHKHFPSILEEEHDFPRKVFKACDADGDGMISFEEFEQALRQLHYEEIKEMHKTIHQVVAAQSKALEKKMELILNIEDQLVELSETCEEKEEVYYNNIGMTTASEIDVLFARSGHGRAAIRRSIAELKGLVEEAKIIYSRSWETDL
jgi:hypothetical protein